ncbi:MAG: SLC13 family permease [Paludibacteraceae bacterium]|nr:SLC13 family permease [Paludibacteraceae bacterium]
MLTWSAIFTLLVLVVMFGVLLFTEIEPALVFGGGMAAFCVSGVLTPDQSFSGFSDTSVITIIVLYLVIAGLTYSHVLEWIVKYLMGLPKTLSGAILRLMVPVGVLSAFLSNTAVVALFVNVVKQWSTKLGVKPSKLLIPLSYASGMGGICTLIGTPPNMIISGMYMEDHPEVHLGLFATVGVGLICLLVGVLSMLAMQRLLPERKSLDDPTAFDDLSEMKHGEWRVMHHKRSHELVGKQLENLKGYHPHRKEGENDVYDHPKRTVYAAGIMLLMVVLSALNVLPLLKSALLAAVLMLVLRCCNAKQALSAINWNIIMVFAGSIALGEALEQTGLATAIANMLIGLCGNNPIVMLGVLTLFATFITEFVSNTACGAMFYPIAMSAATSVGANPLTFAIALMVAVSSSFATPIGSPTHMLVYQPGGYRFGDFVRVGVPMNLIIWITNVSSCLLIFGI